MRVSDDWLNAVFFLAVARFDRDGTTWHTYGGTGFYMRVQNEWDPDLHRLYFVTARHCIEESQKDPARLYVRVNTEDGGSLLSEVLKADWTTHRDPSIDVAVLAPTFAREGDRALQHTYIEADACVTPEVIRNFEIGVGSEVTAIGLFTPREGRDRNIPVVRSGVIAAMPGELIDDRATPHGPVQAYLAEILSMGGLSGSPVFVHPIAGPHHVHRRRQRPDGRMEVTTEWNQPSFVLGMVRSHWDERPLGRLKSLPQREWINRGVAAVTPISGVLDVLGYDEFRDQRKLDAELAAKSRSSALD